jgi:hypothetical protein
MNTYYSRLYVVTAVFFLGGEIALLVLAALPILYGKPLAALLILPANFVYLIVVWALILRRMAVRVWETDGATWIRTRGRNNVTIRKSEALRVDQKPDRIEIASEHGTVTVTPDCGGYAQLRALAESWATEL